jgi:hypothetical protein
MGLERRLPPLLAGLPVLERPAISLTLAFLVEICLLYHATWIDSIRQNALGGLVLGFRFLCPDFACDSVGIVSEPRPANGLSDKI